MSTDKRKEYILQRVGHALNSPQAYKSQETDESLTRQILVFLDNTDGGFCYFFGGGGAPISASSYDQPKPTSQLRRKVIVAYKAVKNVDVTEENVRDIILFQELTRNVMEVLDNVADSVYSTPLANPANQVGWSDLICNDTLDKFFSLRAQMQVTTGLMKGTTRLPLPPAVPEKTSKDRVHVLESAVILWTKQIRYVLKQDPEAPLKAGLNPNPLTEVKFWKHKAANLNSIYDQLQQDGVKSLLKTLESNKSTYTEPFAKLQQEVADAREEANDNVTFLKTLEPLLADLVDETGEFATLPELFPKIFLTLLLIWTHSKFYNTHPRLVVLVREMCNSVIARAEGFVNGQTLLSSLTEDEAGTNTEGIDKLEKTLQVCTAMKETYNAYKSKAERQAAAEDGTISPAANWKKVQNHALFSRLDTFRERVRDVLDLSKTVIQFAKLQQFVQIGGSKGDLLTTTVQQVCADFTHRLEAFKTEQGERDVLDVSDKTFDTRLFLFRADVKELERKLASVLTSAFDDSDTISARLKLFESFEPMLSRPIIQDEIDRKYSILIEQFRNDIKAVQQLFLTNRNAVDEATDNCPLYANMPPIAGSIFWARSLQQRLTEPLGRIQTFTQTMRAEGDIPDDLIESERLTNSFVNLVKEYEVHRIQKWEAESVTQINEKLQNFLLKRNEQNLIQVNFSPELVCLLREVKYFRLLNIDVPRVAQELFDKAETYRKNTEKFDEIAEKYNTVLTELFPIEEPLLADKIAHVDSMLRPGMDQKRWNEDELDGFIANSLDGATQVASIVDTLKDNLKQCSTIIHQWNSKPLIEHKQKPMIPEDFEATHRGIFNNLQLNIAEEGKDIHRVIRNSADALRVSKNSSEWIAYTEFVNDVVQEGISQVVRNALNRLCFFLDPANINKTDCQPIFETRLNLEDGNIVMDPTFASNEYQNSVRDVLSSISKCFFQVGAVVQRLDGSGDFLVDLREDMRLQASLAQVSHLIDAAETALKNFCGSFDDFRFLWTLPLEEAFEDFLSEGPKELIPDFKNTNHDGPDLSFRQIMETIKLDIGPAIPDISIFESEVQRLEGFANRIHAFKSEIDIHFMRIAIGPLLERLTTLVGEWIKKYKTFLFDHVCGRINEVAAFIGRLETGLTEATFNPKSEQTPEDKERLYAVMTHVRDQKLASMVFPQMFVPIGYMIHALKRLSTPAPEDLLIKFDQFGSQWAEVNKLCYSVREKISDLQAREALNIVKKLDEFDKRLDNFHQKFTTEGPVNNDNFTATVAYKKIDELYLENQRFRAEAKKNNDLETLFDRPLSSYKALDLIQKDLTEIKMLWDFHEIVRYTFDNWRGTPFKSLTDLDVLTDRTRKLQTQFKEVLPASVRGWPLYKAVNKELAAMNQVLPMVEKLKSETMGERHWNQLKSMVGKDINYESADFKLSDLLALKLHERILEVEEICDVAEKEAKNKLKIGKIAQRWDRNMLTFEYKDEQPGVPLLGSIELIKEDMENDAQDVLALKTQGKSIEFIQDEVEKWDRYLSGMEFTLKDWGYIQSEWIRLEPIFMKSEDIRSQLPSDTATFEEKVDNEFKKLMMEVVNTPKAVQACCSEGRHDHIKEIKANIEKCTKALNEYLEQKKKMFPRFYFVSNQTLLTILSNGNKPKRISPELSNCFDGIKCWDFDLDKDPDGFHIKGMYSKENEYVDFKDKPFIIGKKQPVEDYLSAFERHMQLSMKEQLIDARIATEHWDLSPAECREMWLRNYCAQIALVASQIVWTEETARAFDELEGGSETAMKDYKRVCDDRLSKLIDEVLKPLEQERDGKNLRNKIITLITIDVHARDVIEKFVQMRLQDSSTFQWHSQLRFYWANPKKQVEGVPEDESTKDCVIRICDWTTLYAYEYVGNCGRLVITPLTDRCYITLTQALNLTLGGAPAGPAGTGKTETTKDLSRAIGLPVFVFNCSDQMDYKNTANIFMGLAQTGAWGCFDEFNRISVEVLSVVASQVKCILDAITVFNETKDKTDAPFRFKFTSNDEHIALRPTCGFFITMNPGYAGRSELPENLKALFRSCAMVVPDTMFICENMLMAEGFQCARELAHKFVTLYGLSKELLSKARHYDWGLRAVKAVLRQAGGLLRQAKAQRDKDHPDGKKPTVAENNNAEQIVLKKALRDFNLPKIVVPDQPIFERLIDDLFPRLDAPKARDWDFEKIVAERAVHRKLQKVDNFCLKVAQLRDILVVRHCCFVLGPPGSAKSSVWKTLMDANRTIGEDGLYKELNPKAITTNELYGYQKDVWKDGVISTMMRDMSKEQGDFKPSHAHKWIILDGDIDAVWIESMNTVMDDNKVLTLVSNERINFQPSMRLIFEIENMREASPATVSRGGVLFINETDVGWRPYVDSWRDSFEDSLASNVFDTLFTQHFEGQIDSIRKDYEFITPIYDISLVNSVCHMVSALMKHKNFEKPLGELFLKGEKSVVEKNEETRKWIYECFFAFAFMWTIGGACSERTKFASRVKSLFKNCRFPDLSEASVFDFKFDYKNGSWDWYRWSEYVDQYVHRPEQMFANIIVPTIDTTRIHWITDLHMRVNGPNKSELKELLRGRDKYPGLLLPKPILFIGEVGTGKTVLAKNYLRSLDPNNTISSTVNLNHYTDSYSLQMVMESSLINLNQRTLAPPGQRKLIYFIDDLNMPEVDKYGTQVSLALLRQFIDYEKFFDRADLSQQRQVIDCQFMACQNPKAGSFTINPQLQRHFTIISTAINITPLDNQAANIFSPILRSHLDSFDRGVSDIGDKVIQFLCKTYLNVSVTFVPTAAKFHYNFNLRDISNVLEGCLNSVGGLYKGQNGVVKYQKLVVHELSRVFADRMVNSLDRDTFAQMAKRNFNEFFGDVPEVYEGANIFTAFVSVSGGNDKRYLPIKDMDSLRTVLTTKLNEYNEQYAQMPLVLFADAMEHVTRISRVIDTPAGNALLVGVGGSGKQSLSKLAVFALAFDVYQFVVSSSFGMSDLKLELQNVTTRAAVKPASPTVLIVTDQQIVEERFLVAFNDFLSSGSIPELYPKEEFEGILSSLRNIAKAQGFPDSPEGQLAYFIDKTRRNLHMIICHSPVGDTLRIRGRRFPALISCTVIDWFQPWPKDALIDVAMSFIKDVDFCDKPSTMEAVAQNMAEVHLSIEVANQKYREQERRFNYTTPKSFLELISFYKKLLAEKRALVKVDRDRLSNGLETLKDTASTVTQLKAQLAEDSKKVDYATEMTNIAIANTAVEADKAAIEQAIANEKAEVTSKIAADAAATQRYADEKYEAAVPEMMKAKDAVKGLKKEMIAEMKKLGTVSNKVMGTIYSIGLLLGWMKPNPKIDWSIAKRVLDKKSSPAAFIEELTAFVSRKEETPDVESECESVEPERINSVIKAMTDNDVDATVSQSSVAAGNLYNWLSACVNFWKIYQEVKPLKLKSDDARATKEAADAELGEVMERLAVINEKVATLKAEEQKLKDELAELSAKAKASADKLDLAERLVNGLASENHRWSETVSSLSAANVTLIGDALLAAAFVSYIGAFSAGFRRSLWADQWLPDIQSRGIPCSENPNPLEQLATKKDMATWKKAGLPADMVSLENAAIVCSCSRWPLMIDPQMQGIKWIRGQFGESEDGFVAFTLNADRVMNKIESAMRDGKRLLIEAVPQDLDAALDPLLSRAVVKNGKNFKINFNGNKDAEYHPSFKLFLQTKLPNPHYRPEVAAQCTIINFIVTPIGLEEQILAFVVDKEQPELELRKQQLVAKLNDFSVQLFDLENKLLDQLMSATSDREKSILDNADVVLALEATKRTSTEIQEQIEASKVTEDEINRAREEFRSVAAEGSMLYFLLIELYLISPMYQFSLDAFNIFLLKGIEKAEKDESIKVRCGFLLESIRQTVFTWISRGLFEKDKLIFLSMLTFKLLERGQLADEYNPVHMNFLFRGPVASGITKPDTLDWLPDVNYFAVCELIKIPGFELFAQHLEKEAPGRFKEWFNELAPEDAKLPLDWKRLDQKPLEKLLVLRCLRPDRMASALTNYMRTALPNGAFYVDGDAGKNFQTVLSESLQDATPTTPIFFILSPGADPIKELEALGRGHNPKMIMGQNLEAVSMGQGQDKHALNKLQQAHKEGGWVMLQNIHLMPKFLPLLEKRLDEFAAENSHPNFRCFLSSDPIPETNTEQQIPIGILQRCIKLTNEPPAGLKANLDRALAFFPKDEFEDQDAKVKAIMFGLCYFHAVMLERKKFGAMGWNMNYPFAIGDLRDSQKVLLNYMGTQNNSKVPWDDLRYLFGEIMYGGHIVDARDRLLCSTYLDLYMKEDLLDSVALFPFITGEQAFFSPPPGSYERYKEHIQSLPAETPIAYGLHPNAEIGFRTAQCNNLYSTLLRLMPVAATGSSDDSSNATSGQTPQALVQTAVRTYIGRVEREHLDVEGTAKSLRADDKGPYQYVFLQECEYMNIILDEIKRSLIELQLGLEGKLSMSDRMEKLFNEIYMEHVPHTWANVAYPSTRPLKSWFDNLMLRFNQLHAWTAEPQTIAKVVKVNLLINPQSFLTAIKQVNSQLFGNELNKLTIVTDVTKRTDPKQIEGPAKEGAAYVSGFSLEGARWDIGNGNIEDSRPKELFCPMPIVCCNAKLETDKMERNVYQCPVYKTAQRAVTYVFTAQLRTKQPAAKWVLAGVSMILDTGVDAKDEAV